MYGYKPIIDDPPVNGKLNRLRGFVLKSRPQSFAGGI